MELASHRRKRPIALHRRCRHLRDRHGVQGPVRRLLKRLAGSAGSKLPSHSHMNARSPPNVRGTSTEALVVEADPLTREHIELLSARTEFSSQCR